MYIPTFCWLRWLKLHYRIGVCLMVAILSLGEWSPKFTRAWSAATLPHYHLPLFLLAMLSWRFSKCCFNCSSYYYYMYYHFVLFFFFFFFYYYYYNYYYNNYYYYKDFFYNICTFTIKYYFCFLFRYFYCCCSFCLFHYLEMNFWPVHVFSNYRRKLKNPDNRPI